jgi:type I restriction enzyme S subunit
VCPEVSLKRRMSPTPRFSVEEALVAYDNLIENNTRRIAILEEMAQALYQEWFIRFRFPGHEKVELVHSQLGMIPDGWKVVSLRQLTEPRRPITYGVVKPGGWDADGVLFVRGGDIKNGSLDIENLRTISQALSDTYKRTLLRGGEVLVSLVGNPGEVAIAPKQLAGANIARQVGMIAITDPGLALYVFFHLMSSLGRSELTANTTGSVQKVINLVHLKDVRVVHPPQSIIKAVFPILSPMACQLEILRAKSRLLRKTRDLLLPKLISGRLDVEHLDIDVGETVTA